MSTLSQYIRNLDVLENDLHEVINSILKKNQGKILSMIKLRLYRRGIDGSGNKITPFYADETVFRKKAKGQTKSHVTLRDKGNFYKGMYLTYSKGIITIYSKDFKTPFLEEKYGSNILALTKQEQEIIVDTMIEPGIFKEINKRLNSSINITNNLGI